MECLFCRIAAGEIPAKIAHQDEVCVAFHDLHPQAPTHILIVPREHLADLNEANTRHEAALGHIMKMCGEIARGAGVAEDGYRTVINTGANAGQSVFHLHVHLLGGRTLGWPPG